MVMELVCYHNPDTFTVKELRNGERVTVDIYRCTRCEVSWRGGESAPRVVIGRLEEPGKV